MALIKQMKFGRIYIIGICISLFSCDTEEKKTWENDVDEQVNIQTVDQDFQGDKFSDPVHLEILEELDICSMDLGDSSSTVAKCSPENFEIQAISATKSVKDAFILYTKSSIQLKGFGLPLPLRHIMVFERENGKLVRTNGFRGELTALKSGEGDYKDLVISLYVKNDDTVFDCLYKWKDGQYSFESVEGLDWGEGLVELKPELKDSVSAEIYNTVMGNNLVF